MDWHAIPTSPAVLLGGLWLEAGVCQLTTPTSNSACPSLASACSLTEMPPSSLLPFRAFRNGHDAASHDESIPDLERVPFLTQEPSFERSPDLENGVFRSPATDSPESLKNFPVSVTRFALHHDSELGDGKDFTSTKKTRWFPRLDLSTQCLRLGRRNRRKDGAFEHPHKSNRPSPLRRVLRLLAIALMLL